jgi:hypothetical protein
MGLIVDFKLVRPNVVIRVSTSYVFYMRINKDRTRCLSDVVNAGPTAPDLVRSHLDWSINTTDLSIIQWNADTGPSSALDYFCTGNRRVTCRIVGYRPVTGELKFINVSSFEILTVRMMER